MDGSISWYMRRGIPSPSESDSGVSDEPSSDDSLVSEVATREIYLPEDIETRTFAARRLHAADCVQREGSEWISIKVEKLAMLLGMEGDRVSDLSDDDIFLALKNLKPSPELAKSEAQLIRLSRIHKRAQRIRSIMASRLNTKVAKKFEARARKLEGKIIHLSSEAASSGGFGAVHRIALRRFEGAIKVPLDMTAETLEALHVEERAIAHVLGGAADAIGIQRRSYPVRVLLPGAASPMVGSISPWYRYGDIESCLVRGDPPLDFAAAVSAAAQTVKGLRRINTSGVIHKDIKTLNMLAHLDSRYIGEVRVDLADFGSAICFDDFKEDLKEINRVSSNPIDIAAGIINLTASTRLYLSSELLDELTQEAAKYLYRESTLEVFTERSWSILQRGDVHALGVSLAMLCLNQTVAESDAMNVAESLLEGSTFKVRFPEVRVREMHLFRIPEGLSCQYPSLVCNPRNLFNQLIGAGMTSEQAQALVDAVLADESAETLLDKLESAFGKVYQFELKD